MRADVVIVMLLGPILSIVLALVSAAAASGRIPRNHAVGIRVPSLLASDEAWRAGHAAAVRPAWISLAAFLVIDLVLLVIRPDRTTSIVVSVVMLLVAIVWVGVVAVLAARRTR